MRVSFDDVPLELDGWTPSSSTSSRLYGACPTAMSSPTAIWRDSPAIRALSARRDGLRAQPLRAHRPVPSRCRRRRPRLVPRHSAPTTSGACSPSRVSLSDDLRHELAAITPRSACDRLAELSGLFHSAGSVHLKGSGEVSVHLDVVDSAVARRAFSLLRAFGVGSEIRTYRRRAFEGGTRYQLHVAGDDRALQVLHEAGVLELAVDAARAPAASVSSRVPAAGRRTSVAPSSAAARSAGRVLHISRSAAQSSEGAKFLSRIAEEEGARLSVLDRGRHAVAYAKGLEAIADVLALAGAGRRRSLVRRARRHGGDESLAPTGLRTPTMRISSARAVPPTNNCRPSSVCVAPVSSRSCRCPLQEIAELRERHPTLSLRELALKCRPVATKTAVHRRLRKLQQLASI